MARTVAGEMPSPEAIAACRWLPDYELRVYIDEYMRVGFQGGLLWYRGRTQGIGNAELEVFTGRSIDVPSLFHRRSQGLWSLSNPQGDRAHAKPRPCSDMRGCHLLNGARHWFPPGESRWRPDRIIAIFTALITGLSRQVTKTTYFNLTKLRGRCTNCAICGIVLLSDMCSDFSSCSERWMINPEGNTIMVIIQNM